MKVKYLVVISLLFICVGPSVIAGQLTVRSDYSESTGEISFVVEGSEVPEVAALSESYFSLLEDGKVTVTADAVKDFHDSNWNLALVLCIDASGSYGLDRKSGDFPLDEIKLAVKDFLQKEPFKPQDRVALIAFENLPSPILLSRNQLFGNQQTIREKVDELKWQDGQKTVLYDALYKSLELLENLPASPTEPELKHILVISDGKDEKSSKTLEDVITKAKYLKIAIDVVVRVRADKVQEFQKYGEIMKTLAKETGGQKKDAERREEYNVLNQILRDVMAIPVVYFRRNIPADGKMTKRTKSVAVRLELPGKPTPLDSIPQKILLNDTIPTSECKSTIKKIQFWFNQIPSIVRGLMLALLTLLVIASIVLIGQRLWPRPIVVIPEPPGIDPQPGTFIEPKPVQRDRTKVSGYHFPAPEPGKPTALLIGVSGHVEGQQFSIEKENFHIGASRGNDLHLAEDDYVSGQHAYLSYKAGSLFIYDKDSKNKTYVNQNKVTDRGFDLNLGDRIRIGMSTFKVEKAPS